MAWGQAPLDFRRSSLSSKLDKGEGRYRKAGLTFFAISSYLSVCAAPGVDASMVAGEKDFRNIHASKGGGVGVLWSFEDVWRRKAFVGDSLCAAAQDARDEANYGVAHGGRRKFPSRHYEIAD